MAYDALVERNVTIPRARVFSMLTDFGGIKDILPDAISSCECIGSGVGAVRTLVLADGGRVVERMDVAHDDTIFAYTILENNALPLEHYTAVVTLDDIPNGGTRIAWGSNWTPKGASEEDVRDAIEGMYNGIIDGLVKSV